MHRLEHLLRVAAHLVYHHAVGKAERCLIGARRTVHRGPIAQPHGDDAARVAFAGDIFQIAQHRVGIFADDAGLAAVFQHHRGQLEQHAVPRGAAAPFVSPCSRGHDARQLSHFGLRTAHAVQPFAPAVFRAQCQDHMLGRNLRVARPAVFLAVGAIGGKVEKVRPVAALCHYADRVGNRVRAGKAAALFQIGMQHQKGEQLRHGLLRPDAGNIQIAKAVVGERRLENFFFFAADDVEVPLGVAVGVEIDVVIIRRAVQKLFGALDVDALAGFAPDAQAEDARVVFAKVVEVSALPVGRRLLRAVFGVALLHIRARRIGSQTARHDAHGSKRFFHADGLCPAKPRLPARRFGGKRRVPARVLGKAGSRPAPGLLPGVVKYARAQVVEQHRPLCAAEIGRGERLCFSILRDDSGKGQLRRGVEHVTGKIPHTGFAVQKAVPQHHADHIFAFLQIFGNGIRIVIYNVVRIGDVGREISLGDFAAVHKQLVEAQPRNHERSGGVFLCEEKRFAEQRRGDMGLIGGALGALAKKLLWKFHRCLLLPPPSKNGRRKLKLTNAPGGGDNKNKKRMRGRLRRI